ncbi:hypothetical protein [Roseiterribacter gracilis]|uniref:Tyr recombinase domain-containing protein n=1 Tax=Roseiterribacter gracilis TaxID=2812848 RepID=A0A8S8XFL0_9PROT|nr:hypothetical protein TMPK1_29360 [Rhodospirillales bacterium TMPK1]
MAPSAKPLEALPAPAHIFERRGANVTRASLIEDDVWDGVSETEGCGKSASARVIRWRAAMHEQHRLGVAGSACLLNSAKRLLLETSGDRASFSSLGTYFNRLKPLLRWMSSIGVREFGNLTAEEFDAFMIVRYGEGACARDTDESLIARARAACLGSAGPQERHRLLQILKAGQAARRDGRLNDAVAFELPASKEVTSGRNATPSLNDEDLARLVGAALKTLVLASEIVEARRLEEMGRKYRGPSGLVRNEKGVNGLTRWEVDLQAAAYVVIAVFTVTARPADIVEMSRNCITLRRAPGRLGHLDVAMLTMHDVKCRRRVVQKPAHSIVLHAIEALAALSDVHPNSEGRLFFVLRNRPTRGDVPSAKLPVSAMVDRVASFAELRAGLATRVTLRGLRATVFDRLCCYPHGFSAAYRWSHEDPDTTSGYARQARFDAIADAAIPKAMSRMRSRAP